MKKTLLSLGLFLATTASFAQVDTITSHITYPNIYSGLLDDVAPIDTGFFAGTNAYGDKAKMQLFDASYGVTSGGVINGVALLVVAKNDAGTGSINVNIYSDNSGTPSATPIATVNVTLASIDTTIANTGFADGNIPYNHVAMFPSPIAIPAGNKFWAGFTTPTGTGNALAVAISGPFAAASTHSGEIWSDDSFHYYTDANGWGSSATYSTAIFPIVDLTASLQENVITSSVYPNPANNELNIQVGNDEIETVSIVSLDGKKVLTATTGTINVSDLNAGMYIYNVTTKAGKLATGNFIKK